VIEIVREGVQPIMDLLKEYEDVNNKFADEEVLNDPDKMEKLIARQGVLQDQIEAPGAWEIDQKLDIAMDALRCPEPDAKISVLSGGERRRVALCRLLLQAPDILLLGRTHQPLGCRKRGLAGTSLGRVQRHRDRHHPRSLLPGQRGRLDPGTGPR
jgi:ABC-type dipeptide/oligopeptide/nickel transport system ATPase subunit